MVSIDRAHLIDDVLSRLPAHERRSVMGEAIRNAGTLNLPPDDEAFLSFVRGPFAQAAQSVLGEDRAAEVVDAVVAKLQALESNTTTLPLGRPPIAPRPDAEAVEHHIADEHTLPYGGQIFEDARAIEPATVAVVEPDSGFRDALVELLTARGHDVHLSLIHI